jgi:hypothetical protein
MDDTIYSYFYHLADSVADGKETDVEMLGSMLGSAVTDLVLFGWRQEEWQARNIFLGDYSVVDENGEDDVFFDNY